MRSTTRAAFLALLLTGGFAGAASAQYAPIPPPRFERVPPPPPGPRVVWEPGHWRWDGRAYAWDAGRYVGWRREYRHYVPGEWVFRGGTRIWVPPHWG
jgi:hypothetical protein